MENKTLNAHPVIEKEQIVGLHFPQTEVLGNLSQKQQRQLALDKACRLGNEYKGKVKIVFQSEAGIMEVHTTIWNVSTDTISLKGGIFIPISCIYSIEYL